MGRGARMEEEEPAKDGREITSKLYPGLVDIKKEGLSKPGDVEATGRRGTGDSRPGDVEALGRQGTVNGKDLEIDMQGKVLNVRPGCPADVEGIIAGMIMVEIDGQKYTTALLEGCNKGKASFVVKLCLP